MTILSVSQKLISAQKFQKIDVQKRSIVSSLFSIDTVKSTCKAKKKSAIACSISSLKSSISTATSKQIFEFALTFEIVISQESSHFSVHTSEIVSESKKNESTQCFSISSKSSSQTFESKHQEISIQQIVCAQICKRCKQNFNFNNKFHEHIRQHHARKSIKSSDFRVSTSEFTCKIKKKSTFTCLFVSSIFFATFTFIFESILSKRSHLSIATLDITSKQTKIATMLITRRITSKRVEIAIFNCSFVFSSISFATSRSQIFSTKTVSRFISSSSNLSIATHRITSNSMKKLSITSFRTSVSEHQKSYLILNDLSRMFVEKSRSFDLRQHHNCRFFQQSFDIRQSRSIKSHLIVKHLFEMFDEKFRRKNLFQSQNNVSFQTFSDQMQITIYFKLTIIQRSSIDQNSKSSNSKNLNQHMFAKSIRTIFSENLSEKRIKLLYKMLDVFDETSFFIFILFRFFSIFLLVFAIVSIMSAAAMSCINVYEQTISIIDRVIQ